MPKFEYHNPQANKERGEDPRHTFELKNDAGDVIAGAEIDYYATPIPFYQITDIWVEYDEQGKGVATALMDEIESMLKKKKKAGFLVDAIMENNPARGFYERRGWQVVPGGKDQYVYNLPKSVTPEIFIAAEHRQTSYEDRGAV